MIRANILLLTLAVCSASWWNVSVSAEEAEQVTVRLWFTHRTWDDVLSSYAEATGKQLVMPNKPSGRWNRHDREDYTAQEALRIINHELEEKGFQAIVQGNFLIVLPREQLRSDYSRHVIQPAKAEQTAQAPHQTMSAEAGAVQQAGYLEEETETNAEPAPRPELQQEALSVEPRFLDATTLSKKLYAIYQKQAELIDEGPLGLPSFQVDLPQGENGTVSFTVGIDQQGNRLIVMADPQTRKNLVQVLDVLDRTGQPKAAGEKTEVMYAEPNVYPASAKQLPKVLAMLQKDQPEKPADPAAAPAETPAADPNSTPVDGQSQEPPADLNSILDRIRGDVSIEALNQLGLLILRGNEQDVASVMEIVRAIEALSAGTTPEIHLRYLEQVNSESLAELLGSVYESVQASDQRANRQNRNVKVIPVVTPNAIIIIAPAMDLEAVLSLVEELDRPVDPHQHLRVFRLKHAGAETALAVIDDFYEDKPGLRTRARVAADARTNTLIVQADPRDLEEIRILIHNLDQAESHAVSRLQLFPLKNAEAEELAEFINTAINEAVSPRQTTQGGGQNNQNAKSFVLEFLAGSGTQTELVRSGLLEDIRISADPRSNSLAVIAPERSLPLITSLIQALDRPSSAEAEVKVFTLMHADASAALELLQSLFDETGTDSPAGLNLAGTADAGSSLLPLRFSVDVRSNSLLAVGGRDALTIVEAILLRLDNPAPRRRINQVVELRNIAVVEAAEAINLFLESQRELSEVDPELVSTFELLEREVIIVPETLSNNLLISATPEYFSEIMALIQQLDADPAQLIIQAMLVEVELDNVDEFGVELGFQDSILFDRSIIDNILTVTSTTTNQNIQTTTQQIVSRDGNPGFLFNNPALFPNLGNNVDPAIAQPNLVGSQGLANFGVGRVNGDLGYGGLVLSASSESVSVLIRALAQQRNLQILSRPQIRTVDQQLAQIQVGQEVPIINGVNITSTGVANPNIEYDEAGIILSVTPRVKPDGEIVMEVVAERSAFQAEGVTVFVDANTGNSLTSPVKNISVARATVGVSDGQTIVLGGMITKTEDTLIRKVPWLGDIPVIGRAFRYDSEQNIRTELLIFLTPRIIHNDDTNEMIKEVEAGRIHFFREDFEKIHGPIFGVPVPPTYPAEVALPPGPDGTFVPEGELAPVPLEQLPNAPGVDGVPTTQVAPGVLKPVSGVQDAQKAPSGIPWKRYSLYSKKKQDPSSGHARLGK
ncbi:MAG: hypothetical protein KDA78_03590 [Planctomycetaceae bacterium]|nr:hypothetical protein [Planctomycetaceae bacterium]